MARLLELEDLPIRLTARGTFLHGHEPMHPRVASLFARHLVPEKDGGFRIQLGFAQHPVEVEDTGFCVKSLSLDTHGDTLQHAYIILSDGASESLAAQSLMQSADHVLYCRILRYGLQVATRLTAQQYHTLALYMEPYADAATGYALRLDGQLWPVGRYNRAPIMGDAD